ncbi:MAG: response regulator, partial [candidate division Zixibacteria bacterium]|nr:response regulator [candidate division Zixibacteria bacterium]
DAVLTTDTNGSITMLNEVAEELTGWRSKDAVGRPLTEVFRIINEKTRKPCENPFEKVMLSGAIVGLANHTVLIARDGTERLLSDSGAPIRNQSGDIIGVILVFRDVTEARRLQEYVSRARRLETAGRIAGQIAHDFNNLLSPLVAYPEFIRNELDENHSAVELLNDMERVALRMADVNQQLLTLSRRGHYDQAPMNLNEVIREVIKQRRPTPETLVIDTKLSEDLMNMKGGVSQIHRIVSNLVGNALDAMKNVGRLSIKTENFYADTTSVRFGRVPRGEYVLLTISDTGCGIPDGVLPKIFDPFFTTKVMDKGRGTGLGLSIVNAVVEDHGGHIDLETTIGEGTSFYVFFPITREVTETTPVGKDIVGGSERILVVDDDEIQRDVAMKMLEKLGYHAGAVESGERALEFVSENPQDLLILDMVMEPGIDGTETYRRALEINPTQRAIIVSGYAESDRVEVALEMGAGAFVRKPLSLKVLAVALRKELDRKLETA